MKQKLKFFFIVIVGLCFIAVGFYFWASAPNLSYHDYNESSDYDFYSPISNDSVHSIITYNIGYLSGMSNNLPVERLRSLFEENLNKAIYEIKKTDADILALQEIDYDSQRSYHMDQQKELAKIGYTYFGKSINWDKKYVPFPYLPVSSHFGKVISGQSILSKYPITDLKRITLQRNPDNPFYYDSFYLDRLAQVAKIKIKDKILVLINVHLEAYDSETRKRQIKEVKNLYIKYYREYPTILLGDFNSDIQVENAGINILLNMSDTGCAAFDPSGPQNTFSSENPTERLDYIFYNKNFIHELDARVMDQLQLTSDHLPLLMKFKFKDQQYAKLRPQPNP